MRGRLSSPRFTPHCDLVALNISLLVGLPSFSYVLMSPFFYSDSHIFDQTKTICTPSQRRCHPKWTAFPRPEDINTAQPCPQLPQYPLIFIYLLLSVALLKPPMNTRRKNKTKHPGAPDMTPSQLASAGLPHTPRMRRPLSKKKTKDQQLAAMREEMLAKDEEIHAQRHLLSVSSFASCACIHCNGIKLFISAILIAPQHMATVSEDHRTMLAAILTLRPMLKRLRQARNARPRCRLAQGQGLSQYSTPHAPSPIPIRSQLEEIMGDGPV